MKRSLRYAWAALTVLATTLPAQERAIPDRIGAPTRRTLERLIDSARTAGIPVGPLYDKVAEGTLKGADDERILRAAQSLTRELGDARGVLGPSANVAVLSAAASALHVGVAPAELRRLAYPPGMPPDQPTLMTALVTLVDLVAKHVPVGLATTSIQLLIDHRAGERQFNDLRGGVEQDVLAGRSPEASLGIRMKMYPPSPPTL